MHACTYGGWVYVCVCVYMYIQICVYPCVYLYETYVHIKHNVFAIVNITEGTDADHTRAV